jgi:hypothetical protein
MRHPIVNGYEPGVFRREVSILQRPSGNFVGKLPLRSVAVPAG